jgi:hypothetical protein
MKTSELTGAALDWAVAKCEGWESVYVNDVHMLKHYHPEAAHTPHCYIEDFGYSTDWQQGGPIIEREIIVLTHPKYDCWTATAQDSTDLDMPLYQEDGATPLIAAMRCFVASKLGDEVEIPVELTKGETS